MASGSSVDFVPDELLSHVFNFFTLDELLPLMPVARRWRTLVIDHRTYWMYVHPIKYSDSSATLAGSRLFGLRLSRAACRPTNVTVDCHNATDVLPHIAAHLSHIKRLRITTSVSLSADLLTTLCNAAPILESVVIFFHTSGTDRMPDPIPVNLFNFNAPLLEYASFSSVFLEPPLPPVLRHLSRLAVGGMVVHSPDVRFDVPDIFAACPNLRDLMLCEEVALHPVFWEPRAWTRIERLSLSGGTIGRTWHHLQLPIHRVPRIDVSLGELNMLPILASHQDGPLTLFGDAFADDNRFTISLKSSLSAHERRLCADIPVHNPREIADDAMWTRVVCIILSVDHWDDYVPLFGTLPALEDVVLVQILQWVPLSLTAKLSCPHLKRLIIRNRLLDLVSVDLGSLATLATTTFHGAPFPLELKLISIHYEGSADETAATFHTIVMDNEGSHH